jgi:hypothetical protein
VLVFVLGVKEEVKWCTCGHWGRVKQSFYGVVYVCVCMCVCDALSERKGESET